MQETFLVLAETTGEILNATLRPSLKLFTPKMSPIYQVNPNVIMFFSTILHSQFNYVTEPVSPLKLMFLFSIINYIFIGYEARARISICS